MNWLPHADAIRELYEAKVPLTEIGALYGRDGKQMCKIIGRLGFRKPGKTGKWTREVLATITDMREAGASWVEIGEKYGCTADYIGATYHDRMRRLARKPPEPVSDLEWPRQTMSDREFVARLRATGGFPRFAETINRFGDRVLTPERVWDVRGRRAA